MTTPLQPFPRCTADIKIITPEKETKILQGSCSEVFKIIHEYLPPKMEILEGKISIQFVPEKKEIYTLHTGTITGSLKELRNKIYSIILDIVLCLFDMPIYPNTLRNRSFTPRTSFQQAFESIDGYMNDYKLLRFAQPLCFRVLSVNNLAIRRQDDLKA